MNRELNVQQIGKDILLQAGMGQEEIQKLADSGLPLNVQLINNFAFKKVFRNKKALTGLLSALLEIPAEQIVHLEFLDTLQLGNYRKDKKGILDIKVHLNNNRKINADRKLRYEYISQEIARLDENTRRAEARRKQEKARLEGREEGRLEQSKVIALKLHQKGTSAGEIAEILDVPANQVSDWLRPGSSDTP